MQNKKCLVNQKDATGSLQSPLTPTGLSQLSMLSLSTVRANKKLEARMDMPTGKSSLYLENKFHSRRVRPMPVKPLTLNFLAQTPPTNMSGKRILESPIRSSKLVKRK